VHSQQSFGILLIRSAAALGWRFCGLVRMSSAIRTSRQMSRGKSNSGHQAPEEWPRHESRNESLATPARSKGAPPTDELGVFGPHAWNLSDAFQGTQIFGGTGSGKTTGSGAAIALAYLRAGLGGLVLTAKSDDLNLWREFASQTGRGQDIIEISDRNGAAFNILDYEYRQTGYTRNLVSMLLAAVTTGGDPHQSVSSDPYWNDAMRELLMHATDLLVAATTARDKLAIQSRFPQHPEFRLAALNRLIRSAPESPKQLAAPSWRRTSFCWELLTTADAGIGAGIFPDHQAADIDATIGYWTRDFPGLAAKTRSIVVSSLTSKLATLLRSPFRQMFFEGSIPQFDPGQTFRASKGDRGGKIIVINTPVKELSEVGKMVQILYKTAWMRAADRRAILFSATSAPSDRPVDNTLTCPAFLWADEAQYFITAEDLLFQQTARASRVATVYLTQNIDNYRATLGRQEHAVYSLLGNLQTKIFHANGDTGTNRFAEEIFGKNWVNITAVTKSRGDSLQNGQFSVSSGHSSNTTMQHANTVEARDITMLASGGTRFGYKIEAYVFQAGRNWTKSPDSSNPINAFRHIFEQWRGRTSP